MLFPDDKLESRRYLLIWCVDLKSRPCDFDSDCQIRGAKYETGAGPFPIVPFHLLRLLPQHSVLQSSSRHEATTLRLVISIRTRYNRKRSKTLIDSIVDHSGRRKIWHRQSIFLYMVCLIRFFRRGISNVYSGMTCQSCVKSVTSALSSLEGVKNVSVSLPNSSATINYDPSIINEDQLIEAIEDCGFDTTLTEQDSSPLLKNTPNDLVQLTTLPPMSIADAKSKEKSGVTDIAKTTLISERNDMCFMCCKY